MQGSLGAKKQNSIFIFLVVESLGLSE